MARTRVVLPAPLRPSRAVILTNVVRHLTWDGTQRPVADWLSPYEAYWRDTLRDLRAHLDRNPRS
jgi:hypothetical protein